MGVQRVNIEDVSTDKFQKQMRKANIDYTIVDETLALVSEEQFLEAIAVVK